MHEKNANFPGPAQAVGLVVALVALETVMALAVHALQGELSVAVDDLIGIVMVLGYAILLWAVMRHKGLTWRVLIFAPPSSASSVPLMLFPAIVLTAPVVMLVSSTLIEITTLVIPLSASDKAMFAQMDKGSFGMIVALCIVAPVLEEMLFRGVILRSFLHRYARWTAIVGASFLFGLAHGNIYQFIAAMISGTLSGWLYERTRSLLPCITYHAAYNTMCALSGSTTVFEGPDRFSAASYAAALLLGMTGFAVLHRLLSRRRDSAPAVTSGPTQQGEIVVQAVTHELRPVVVEHGS